jgi:hypothetical protein
MAITLRRQLNDEEKQIVLQSHGRKCFANGHLIPDGEPVQFDHIKAYAIGGVSEIDNIAPMCGQHNKEKGVLPLFDFRIKLRLQSFFLQGDKLTLKDLLESLKKNKDIIDFGRPVSVKSNDKTVKVESSSQLVEYPLYSCPTTGWKYFYATLDVEILDSDDDEDDKIGLQPRYLIFEKVFDLFRHFQSHPVLQPSIGRVVGSHIRMFDGQHKIAALLWNGRRNFECKIYLDPELRLLNQTNISAHDKYAQTRFYSSVMVLKLGSQFGQDFNVYKNLEDEATKSEAGFMTWLRNKDGGTLTTAQINERFRSYLYSAALEHENNGLARLVSAGNRGSDEKPITLDMLHKSLFSCFLYREPAEEGLTTEAYKRDVEIQNLVWLLNTLDALAFVDWNPKKGQNDENQRRLSRLLRSKSMMAWAELLRDAVCAKIDLHDSDEKGRPLYRNLTEQEQQRVKSVCERLVNWKRWSSPADDDIDRVLADNKSEVKSWFRSKGLTTGYLMGAAE